MDVGVSVASERLSDPEKATELGDVARYEEDEASVVGFESAVLTAPRLGDDAICEDEKNIVEASRPVVLTRPAGKAPRSGPLQHPA